MDGISTTELILSVISIIAAIIASSAGLGFWLGKRFADIDARFAGVETKISNLESRIDKLESRIDRLESRIGGLESRVGSLESEVSGLRTTIERIGMGFSSYQEFFVELLVSEGVITREKGDLARGEVRRNNGARADKPLNEGGVAENKILSREGRANA